ncbi:uncharacterized protein [Physcomitrium patens]|uniref:Uncharacterized protein n=1 Tax=Physcomitrium patens TaxID=3218 RepID=A0A2K1J0W5_PHYPA|nr:uncharacterized protein LOC112295039 isoform X2 [Physcomitrium patens]PNR35170.1 hypothetical protein PHYPA_023069 [Physcomitrium patens]|eukprot:XP_024401917.1 uncharacterized protein LOC112295039 isoform X2 [Physcomitrella patens]
MTMATMGVAALSDCAAASLASPFATLTSLHRSKTAARITIDRACRDWSSLAVLSPGMNPASHTRRNYSAEKKCCLHQMPITAAHRKANLRVRKQESVPLVTLTDPSGVSHHLSSFLQQPAGTQSMLNTRALMRYEYVGDDVYRCYLPKVTLLNFEVAPIVDLFVAASDVDCRVDMRQCSFTGSKAIQDQNERFSASLKNHLTWHDTPEGDQVLNLETELSVSLEVYTVPFTMLPLSAVEVPGNAIMQTMLDQLIPLFLDSLFSDYKRWVDEEALGLGVNTIPLSPTLGSSPHLAAPDCQPLQVSS